ncbi:MAG: type III pantothenate kinase [Campylobacteraceae bacterium]|nr:type III pantothenate kinase [Campylobacteraceae bacterium]
MILCDIGNTNAHLLRDGEFVIESLEKFLAAKFNGEVYYICVNDSLRATLKMRKNFTDLESFIKFDTSYKGMGIDRICACKSIREGIVVDAGSAITVDVMSDGKHQGGFILPGLRAYKEVYGSISPRLDFDMNREVLLSSLPKNTQDAISFAILKSLILMIHNSSEGKSIYFTGGDGEYLSSFFENGIFDKMVVFKTLLSTVEELKKGKFKC